MEMLTLLQELMTTGADAATIAIAVALFKVERRVHVVEMFLGLKDRRYKKITGGE